ncbi:hypothetical protein V8C86DRAFT_2457495 [Haematococcus lacustris]
MTAMRWWMGLTTLLLWALTKASGGPGLCSWGWPTSTRSSGCVRYCQIVSSLDFTSRAASDKQCMALLCLMPCDKGFPILSFQLPSLSRYASMRQYLQCQYSHYHNIMRLQQICRV